MIMQDQKHRPTHREEISTLKSLLMGFILLISFIALISEMSAPQEKPVADAYMVTGATYDNLMSPERAGLMVCCEHGENFDEGDMQ